MCFVYPIYLTHAIKCRYFSYFSIAFKITISNRQIFEVFKTGLNYKISQHFKNNKKIKFVTKSGFPLINSIQKVNSTAMVATELCKFGKLFTAERKWNPKNFSPTDKTVFEILSHLKPSWFKLWLSDEITADKNQGRWNFNR